MNNLIHITSDQERLSHELLAMNQRLLTQISEIGGELAACRQWKSEMITLLDQINLPKCGKALDLKLGYSITKNILPALERLRGAEAKLFKIQNILTNLADHNFVVSAIGQIREALHETP